MGSVDFGPVNLEPLYSCLIASVLWSHLKGYNMGDQWNLSLFVFSLTVRKYNFHWTTLYNSRGEVKWIPCLFFLARSSYRVPKAKVVLSLIAYSSNRSTWLEHPVICSSRENDPKSRLVYNELFCWNISQVPSMQQYRVHQLNSSLWTLICDRNKSIWPKDRVVL